MKKTLLLLALALALTLPILGLAADTATETETTGETAAAYPNFGQYGRRYRQLPAQPGTDSQSPSPFGMMRGRRANQAPAAGQAPFGRGYSWNNNTSYGFTDENKDGVCDNCGLTHGTNPQAPGYVDENSDSVCDNLGTAMQRQGGMGRGRNRR